MDLAHPVPDGYFYYGIAILFGGFIIAILWRYVDKQERLNERIVTAIDELVRSNIEYKMHLERHDEIIEEIKLDIRNLKNDRT